MTLGPGAYREALATGFSVAFTPGLVAARTAVAGLGGLALAAMTGSPTAGFATALGALVLLFGVQGLRLALSYRSSTRPGTIITSGYDEAGDLLVLRPGVVRRLPRGSVRQATKRRGLWLLRPVHARQKVLMVREEVLTPDDLTFLTTAAGGTHPEGSILVTPELQRRMVRGTLRHMLAPDLLPLWALLVLLPAGLLVVYPETWPVAVFTASAIVVLLLLTRSGTRIIWAVGTAVRARVEGDALVLSIPRYPERVALSRIRRVRRHGDLVELRWQRMRRWLIPRSLLTEDDLAVLEAAVLNRT